MSLHQLAQHTAKAGRNGDSTLVHMTPSEVASLQALARQHGTTLTINPQTGLPEAFSLKSLLPMLAGAALGPAGFGIFSSAMGAAAAVGGLSALTSGSLTKGLMDGLGAYGGANLASGLGTLGGAGVAADPGVVGMAGANTATAGAPVTAASRFADIGAGLTKAVESPSALANTMGGWGKLAGAAAPVVLPMLADQATPTVTKMPSTGQIRNFGGYNPLTQQFEEGALAPVPTSRLADGGQVQTITQMPGQNNMTGASRSAYDYLMGLSPTSRPQPITTMPVTPPGGSVIAPVDVGTNVPSGRYVWDAATKKYSWVANDAISAPVPAQTGIAQLAYNDGAATDGAPAPAAAPVGDTSGSLSGGVMGAIVGFGAPSDSVSVSNAGTAAAAGLGGTTLAGPSGFAGEGFGGFSDSGITGITGPSGFAGEGFGGFSSDSSESVAPAGEAASAPSGDGAPSGEGTASGGDGWARGGGIPTLAGGGLGSLGGYSDGGQLLRGPGDGVSDDIPAHIGGNQPARLADGEFVVPARIVSELGNGSTEAGARALYKMMDRIQAARGKTVGKNKVAVDAKAARHLPA